MTGLKSGSLLLLWLAVLLTTLAHAQGGSDRWARVTLQHHAEGGSGTLEVELLPNDAWSRDIFVSLYRGDFRERKGIRPNEEGNYRLEVRVPEAGEWGVYLRYGVAQAGYAGYGRVVVPPPGGVATSTVALASGFSGDVPGYVQPLGFAVFATIGILVVLGLHRLLEQIRQRQADRPVAG